MTGHTKEPWAYRPDADDDWGIIRAPVTEQGRWLGGIICQARDPERLGESELAACRAAKIDPWEANARRIVDCVNSLAGIENPAAFVQAARVLHRALEGVIDATASHLPPDGISKDDCINRVLAASDNPEVFHALEAFRAATGEA